MEAEISLNLPDIYANKHLCQSRSEEDKACLNACYEFVEMFQAWLFFDKAQILQYAYDKTRVRMTRHVYAWQDTRTLITTCQDTRMRMTRLMHAYLDSVRQAGTNRTLARMCASHVLQGRIQALKEVLRAPRYSRTCACPVAMFHTHAKSVYSMSAPVRVSMLIAVWKCFLSARHDWLYDMSHLVFLHGFNMICVLAYASFFLKLLSFILRLSLCRGACVLWMHTSMSILTYTCTPSITHDQVCLDDLTR